MRDDNKTFNNLLTRARPLLPGIMNIMEAHVGVLQWGAIGGCNQIILPMRIIFERRENMRIKLTMSGENNIKLPLNHNKTIQGLLYSLISELHDGGYVYNKRVYKMFVFSRLQGEYRIKGKNIYFTPPVNLYVDSPVESTSEEIRNNFLNQKQVRLGNNFLIPASAEVIPPKWEQENFYTLSPITVYSTLEGDGKRKTYYYSPREKEFEELLQKNLQNKAESLGLDHENIELTLLSFSKQKHVVLYYEDTVINGWMGNLKLRGSPIALKIAYQAGLGSKNSQGLGMIEGF